MTTDRLPAPTEERHRRMAANHLLPGMTWPQYVKRWVFTGDREDLCGTFLALPSYALFAATVERDARAEGEAEAYERGVVAATRWLYAGGYVLDQAANSCRSALLPEPPRGEGES